MSEKSYRDLSYLAGVVIAHERMLWALLAVYLIITVPAVLFTIGIFQVIIAGVTTILLLVTWVFLRLGRDKYMIALYVLKENLNKAMETGMIPIADCPSCTASTLVFSDEAVVCSNIRCLYMDFFKGSSRKAMAKKEKWIDHFDNYRSKD